MLIQRVYRTRFETAHYIEGHPKCGQLHGHTYHLIAYINGDTGIWSDFHDIKQTVDECSFLKYDHKNVGNKTAEEIAGAIAEHLTEKGYQGKLELFETENFSVILNFGSIIATEKMKNGGMIKYARN